MVLVTFLSPKMKMEIEFILKILVYYVDNGLCVTGNT